MGFWLYQPTSLKNAALFPTGGIGNFLNTVTIAIVAILALAKTKFSHLLENEKFYTYIGLALAITTILGMIFGKEQEEEIDTKYHMDLFYE